MQQLYRSAIRTDPTQVLRVYGTLGFESADTLLHEALCLGDEYAILFGYARLSPWPGLLNTFHRMLKRKPVYPLAIQRFRSCCLSAS